MDLKKIELFYWNFFNISVKIIGLMFVLIPSTMLFFLIVHLFANPQPGKKFEYIMILIFSVFSIVIGGAILKVEKYYPKQIQDYRNKMEK